MQPSAFNHTANQQSFEKYLGEQKKTNFAATGEFKAIAESPALDDSNCRASFFGEKVDERELCIINSDHQTSFFCNDKSGFSMVEAMQGMK